MRPLEYVQVKPCATCGAYWWETAHGNCPDAPEYVQELADQRLSGRGEE